jgi:hypothetical protein
MTRSFGICVYGLRTRTPGCARLSSALFVLAAVFAGMAGAQQQITLQTSGSVKVTAAATTGSISLNLTGLVTTGTGTNNYLLVGVSSENEGSSCGPPCSNTTTVSSIKWGGSSGTALTKACSSQMVNSSNFANVEIWELETPNNISSTVVITLSAASVFQAGAAVFADVKSLGTCYTAQHTGGHAGGSTETVTASFTATGTGGAAFDTLALYTGGTTTETLGSGQTSLFSGLNDSVSGYFVCPCYGSGAGSYVLGNVSSMSESWSNQLDNWTYAAIPLIAANTTALTVSSLTAIPSGSGNLVKLQTGREAHNLGFNIYREQNGQRIKLNSSLLAGSALLGGAGTTFTAGHIRTWQDELPPGSGSVAYWVEEIDLSGARKWYGPVTPEPAAATTRATRAAPRGGEPSSARAVSLNSIGRSPTVSAPMRPVAPATAATQTNLQTQWALAAGQALKLGVSSEGWYRVTQPQLVAAGLNPNVSPRSLHLYVNGVEQPIVVEGEQSMRFGPQNAIDFYGMGLDTIWSGTQEYWLVSGTGTGLRISSQDSSNGPSGASSFPFTVQWQPRTLYFAALLNGDANANSFFGPALDSADPLSQALTVKHLNAGAGGSSTLQVRLQGAAAGPHAVTVTLNGNFVGNLAFNDFDNSASSFPVPNSYLKEGANALGLAVAGGATDVSLVDTVLLTYPHSYIADNNSLRLTAEAGQKVTVSGFSGSAIHVIDITNPLSVSLVPASVSAGAVSFVPAGGGTRTLLAVSSSQFASPASITANHPSSWHSAQEGGDMVIISHASLLGAVAPLAALRQSQGHTVKVIDVEDLYDEFNFGVESPYAIQSFLSSAQVNWESMPAYVLLMGNGTFDPRNYLETAVPDLVPVKLVDTSLLETASDDWFADFNNDGIPEMAIGRIPAETAADATIAVKRLIAYDQLGGGWKNQALLVAGAAQDPTDDFEGYTAAVKSLLPGRVTATQVLAGSDPLAQADVLSGLNAGASLVNYVGHGSDEVWADGLLSSEDAAGLTNGNAAPFVLSMTCLNGYFQDVYTEALAKTLLSAPNGGAVAVWASSGLTDASPQSSINQAMITALYAPGTTIGQAARAAKSGTTDMDVRRTWILFGDPAMKLQ